MQEKIKVIFAGTPNASVYLLQELLNNPNLDIQLIITQPDKPKGRSKKLLASPVKLFSLKHNLRVETPKSLKTEEIKTKITNLNPDLMIVANYAKIIPSNILSIPKFGTICFHPSLLPAYRGSTPIQTALLNQETETGITFFLMDEKIDHGPILYQEKIQIATNDTLDTLLEKTFKLGSKKINSTISDYSNGLLIPTLQVDKEASYTRIITRNDGFFTGKELSSLIWAKYRAYYPWPGIWTWWNDKRLKLTEIEYKDDKIYIKRLQFEGKKEMSLKEFKNGHPTFNLLQ